MADIKITDLAAYTDPVSTDVLPIVDVGSDITKKVSIADLLENAGTGSAAAPSFSFDGDNNTGIYRPGADQLAISTNGTGRLFVNSSGATTFKGGTIFIEATSDTNNAQISLGRPSSSSAGYIRYINSENALAFRTNGSGEDVRIDSSGAVLIGGTLPSAPNVSLRANGVAQAKGGFIAKQDSGYFLIGQTTSNVNKCLIASDGSATFTGNLTIGDKIIHNGDTNTAVRFPANDTVSVETGGSEKVRIDSSGNVGIGTSSPSTKLDVNGSAKFAGNPFAGAATGITFDNGTIRACQDNTVPLFEGYDLGTTAATISFAANGSAEFAGQVTSGTDAFGTNNTGSGLTATGSVIARRSGTGSLWLGYQTGTSAQTSKIAADGSATFAGTMGVGYTSTPTDNFSVTSSASRTTLSINADSGQDTRLSFKRSNTYRFNFVSDSTDNFSIQNSSFSSIISFNASGTVGIGGTLPSAPNIELDGSDGSAEFAGSVSIGGTAAANTIDEYEVGSYTPAFNAGTYSYAFQIGSYVKIGKLVTVIFDLQVSSVTSATTGTIQINLPFTNNNVSGGGIMYPNGTLSVATSLANSTEANTIQAQNNVALVNVKLLSGTGSSNTAQYQDLQANSRFSGSITYTTVN